MRHVAGSLALVAVLVLGSAAAPARTLAAGVIIQVETTADAETPADGKCSLRAAIKASNVGGVAGYCTGSAQQDSIRFNLGSGVPVITVSSALPDITQPVTIRGNTGGATRVKLTGTFPLIVRNTADGTYLGSLVLAEILVDGADSVTIVGNVVDGSDHNGITADYASNLRIGGSNPGTPDPCSGECNRIINAKQAGVSLIGTSGTVTGNFIGVAATGTAGAGNGSGIAGSGSFTIGGTTAAERNIISGNVGAGILLSVCSSCIILGNRIGTNAAGTAAVPNGGAGIRLGLGSMTIGGTATGAGNLISGNVGAGIFYRDSNIGDVVVIQGNRIGTKAGGGALPNGGDGLDFSFDIRDVVIGSPSDPAGRNVIAFNGGAGVRLKDAFTKGNEVRGNSIHHNGGPGIVLANGANESVAPPVITGVRPVSGTACAGCAVDVYSDAADEGARHEGFVTADGLGHWTWSGRVSGPEVTATATTATHSTSAFSAPRTVPRPGRPDGRIRKGRGPLAGDDRYNTTGVGQTRSATVGPGGTVTFTISIQNDGRADRFTLQGGGLPTSGLAVTWSRGTSDISAPVEAGTATTPVIGAGRTLEIRARVKATGATSGATLTRLLTITSATDPTRRDTVRLIVTVS